MFNANIWGTVADWFAAVGTVAAFGFATFIYARDSRLKRYTQAQLIMFRIYNRHTEADDPTDGSAYEVIVENQSDKSIFDLYGVIVKRSLAEIRIQDRLDHWTGRAFRVPEYDLAAIKRDLDGAEGTLPFNPVSLPKLDAHSTSTLEFPVPITEVVRCRVFFGDAMGQSWVYEVSDQNFWHGGLSPISGNWRKVIKQKVLRMDSPKIAYRKRKELRRIRRWERENKQ